MLRFAVFVAIRVVKPMLHDVALTFAVERGVGDSAGGALSTQCSLISRCPRVLRASSRAGPRAVRVQAHFGDIRAAPAAALNS